MKKLIFDTILSKRELLDRYSEISDLYSTVFGEQMERSEWEWFYLENPVASPIVTLYYEENKLVGHYAVVPLLLTDRVLGQFLVYRSMTTMVSPEGRGKGLFVEMAKENYRFVCERSALVLGFPNSQSSPGFEKYLGWALSEPMIVVDTLGEDLLGSRAMEFLTKDWSCRFCFENQIEWRLSRPGVSYTKKDGLITKQFDGVENVLYLDKSGVNNLDLNIKYRVAIPRKYADHHFIEKFSYQFGYRLFKKELDISIAPDLILSDVF